MRVFVASAALLASCATATPRVSAAPPLQLHATHYQSMTGVKLQAEDGAMLCARDLITGSHILRWYCRMGDDSTQYELNRRILLNLR